MKLYIKSMLNIWTLLLFTHAVFDLWYVWYEFSPKKYMVSVLREKITLFWDSVTMETSRIIQK